MISALDFLYIVLAVGLIPVFTLLTMILWRVFKMLSFAEKTLNTIDQIVNFLKELDKIPATLLAKFMSKFDRK